MKIIKDKPKTFIFKSFRLDKARSKIDFDYSFDNGLNFTETITLPQTKIDWSKVNSTLLNLALFNLHLALGIGYYKAYCPKKIVIKSGSLNHEQALFWDKLYLNGLGEFFYKNKLDPRGLINFPFGAKKIQAIANKFSDRCLSPIGGGKDSCLSAEMLKELNKSFTLISLRDSLIQKETSAVVGVKRLIVGREMDPLLFALNKQGALNGHIPISAIYSWVCVVMAVIYDYRQIVFANEASANFGNTHYHGLEINHQYSKSFVFEQDLSAYLHKFVSPDLNYFSLLRPYSELKIARNFSNYRKYFSSFSSCNRNFKITQSSEKRWCGECPKCAFTFSLMSAFNGLATMKKIFGRNLLADKKLLPLFQELWGEKRIKPFDCVGTPEEVKAALLLASRQPSFQKSYIIEYFLAHVANKIKHPEKLILNALKNNFLQAVPDNFKKILILGWGEEGRALYKYYRDLYPDLPLWIADKNKFTAPKDKLVKIIYGKKYLDDLNKFDLIAKGPGISHLEPKIAAAVEAGIELTSVAKIFFAKRRDRIIGVTGTKGKSTTSSLIYSLLKADRKEAYLVGNIGANPLELLNKSNKAYFIYELSSYQLSVLPYSPHIAVFIDLFPDHLPYHRGFKNYAQAKANIARYQNKDDYFIYNGAYPFIKKLAEKSGAHTIEYANKKKINNDCLYYENKKIISLKDINLPGEHNLKNITAAITVAKLLKIKNKIIANAIRSFKGLDHRLELIGKYRGVEFYDDAISTTPESTLAAIEYLDQKLSTIFLGGEDRGYDFKQLAKKLSSLSLAAIVLFPDSGQRIKEALIKAYGKKELPKILETKNMAEAVNFAYQNTAVNKACLLSTASPSYSIFKNFKEKGDLFQKFVRENNK